jgi:hypothetical protein
VYTFFNHPVFDRIDPDAEILGHDLRDSCNSDDGQVSRIVGGDDGGCGYK